MRESTRKLAATPTLFGENRQPITEYLIIPSVSSERRQYIPIGLQRERVIASNLVLVVPNAAPFHFGVLTSTMHMAWVRYVCGRLKSDFRYSNSIVYNNFPWPSCAPPFRAKKQVADSKSKALVAAVEAAADEVLAARAAFSGQSLADLYGDAMPPTLVKAHQLLDRAVDAAYVPDGGKRSWADDGGRVAFLFERYEAMTGGIA